MSYLRMEPSFDQLPDVPALEVGRLAKATSNGNHDSCQGNDLTNTMAMAAAFIVTKNFILQNGLLPAADSYHMWRHLRLLYLEFETLFPIEIL